MRNSFEHVSLVEWLVVTASVLVIVGIAAVVLTG
jgi:hypothetical protein